MPSEAIETTVLQPQAPLPEGHSVVLMRRFDEDNPHRLMIEMIVTNPDRSEETSRPTGEDGDALQWDDAVVAARTRAEEEGLQRVWLVDRTAGPRAQEIIARDGDHSVGSAALDDDDLEEGERGSDMRDRGPDGAPRRF